MEMRISQTLSPLARVLPRWKEKPCLLYTSTLYVYASEGQERYHLYKCEFAYASAKRLTLYEAYYLGYKPCGICNPPSYTGQ